MIRISMVVNLIYPMSLLLRSAMPTPCTARTRSGSDDRPKYGLVILS